MLSPWQEQEDVLLRRLYPAAPWKSLLDVLERSRTAVVKRAMKLGVRREQRDFPAETRERLAALTKARKPRIGRGLSSPTSEREGTVGKACVRCEEWKPLDRFSRHATCAGGRRNICTLCDSRLGYAKHGQMHRDAVRRYQKKNPGKVRLLKKISEGKRHGKIVEGPGIKAADYRELVEKHNGLCAYCKERPGDTMDHVVPLSRGGLHCIENVLPACKRCNFQKHTKTLEEWSSSRGDL